MRGLNIRCRVALNRATKIVFPREFHPSSRGGALPSQQDEKRYWVVSPNVKNDEATVGEWRAASVGEHAAFMGWYPEDHGHSASGYKFAHAVKPGDRILIARRHNSEPEIVGFGVVSGDNQTSFGGIDLPEKPRSLRKLVPFVPFSRAVPGVTLMSALKHTKALAELHPEKHDTHRQVCDWIERELKKQGKYRGSSKGSGSSAGKSNKGASSKHVRFANPPGSFQEDYNFRTKGQLVRAKRKES